MSYIHRAYIVKYGIIMLSCKKHMNNLTVWIYCMFIHFLVSNAINVKRISSVPNSNRCTREFSV